MNRLTTRRIILAVSVLIVLAVVVVGFFQLGQRTATPPPVEPSGTATTTAPSAASPAPASPAEPSPPPNVTGSPGEALPQGPAEAGAQATRTGPAGLPLGYTHDSTGAVNAATNYLIWMNSSRILDKSVADALAGATAADPAAQTAMIESFDLLRSGLENVNDSQTEPARGAYAIADHNPDTARVYVWTPVVTKVSAAAEPAHLWSIFEVSLVWVGDDWRLSPTLVSRVGGAAVDPGEPSGNPSAEEKGSILQRRPADPGEITDSADQSWFEYANAAR